MFNVIRAKCLLLGDSCVGKSALMNSFLGDGNKNVKNYVMTPGVDIQQKQIRIPDTNVSVQLFLFDCSGKEFYKSLVNKMSEQVNLLLICYDVTSDASFNMAETLYHQVKSLNGSQQLKGILYGNKVDLSNRRRVNPKAGRELAQKLGLTYFEGSVKEQQGVDAPFFFLANEWYKSYEENARSLKSLS